MPIDRRRLTIRDHRSGDDVEIGLCRVGDVLPEVLAKYRLAPTIAERGTAMPLPESDVQLVFEAMAL